ncbi:DNA phosphorothioation-associated putative methyltransferase [Ancylothrix sp. C2]|uniref:DNA phosphorothioation-associated putative methyltransferase n=1 Tax=Ancylothrix sp. D3o TaxID=2953691 RepID=UPI0021BAE97D|nr:DNA phosphorothioation-associated putative methyltransferase [Ancylothrix sp. D3o]MCT7949601.1 DNA phosphorothioation-associated putative methyltransferase [Ancylothrix sp. D3o]
MSDCSFASIKTVSADGESATQQREDVVIDVAVCNFRERVGLEVLPASLQKNIEAFFGCYESAFVAAEEMLSQVKQAGVISNLCEVSTVGKHLPNALYVHSSAVFALDPLLRLYEKLAYVVAGCPENVTLIKFQTDRPKVSYLFYPDFDSDPHPALRSTIVVGMDNLDVTSRDYADTNNPPVLHRKETFVMQGYPCYEEFAELTRQEELLGLLDETRGIGMKIGWQQRLNCQKIAFNNHWLVCRIDCGWEELKLRIDRHKAAMARTSLSKPVRTALEADLFREKTTFFDYGCGYGGDVSRMKEKGYDSVGWDPYYFPHNGKVSADIVNIGYVINVIEDRVERQDALREAWSLTKRVLVVSAQILVDDYQQGWMVYGDGIITSRNTFQKYYEQEELKVYIDQVLEADSVPIGLGIYFVFRDEAEAEVYKALKFRSRTSTPRIRKNFKSFEEYQELLTPLMAFVAERGRLPAKGELPSEAEIKAEFGSLRRAFDVILRATDMKEWEAITQKRREDLLVYLALSRFSRRPKPVELTFEAKEDIKGLFGSYKQACREADALLFSSGHLNIIRESCENSSVGKLWPNSFWFHVSALESLDPLLRVYEGCASRTIGRLDKFNVIKLSTKAPKISYLFYPEFDTDPHPLLKSCMQVDLRDLKVSYQRWKVEDNPPVLHEKDNLVMCDYPLYEKFAKLTQQERNWGLLDDFSAISNRSGWLKCLEEHCAVIVGYQLRWKKDADPYKVKLLRSAMRARQTKHN